MDGLEAAALFAEISIAVTGFVSIFVALGSRDESFPVADHIVLKSMLSVSLANTAGACIPLLVSQFSTVNVDIWRISSVLSLLMSLVLNIWLGVFARAEHRRVTGESMRKNMLEMTLGISIMLLYGINLSPLWGPPSSGPYLLALFLALIICAQGFAKSLFRRFLG